MDESIKRIGATRGLKAKIAKALDITSAAVSQWPRVPAGHLPTVELITGIPREELRPDIFKRLEQL